MNKLYHQQTSKLLILLNQTRLYNLKLQLYECDKHIETQTDNLVFILEILNNVKKYLALASHPEVPIQINNIYTPIGLEIIIQKFIENNYNLYYTNQQIVADFLDQHFDTSNTDTLRTTKNIIHINNKTLNTIIETKYKKLIEQGRLISTADYLSEDKHKKLKIIYIQLQAKINIDKDKK